VANGAVSFTFSFSEAVTGFDASKVTVANGSKGTFSAVSDTVYTLVVTPDAGAQGNLTVDVGTTGVTDAAGNQATAPAQVSQPFDTILPTVTITDDTAGVATGAVAVTFTFSEIVTGFDASKVTVANGSKGTFTAVSGTVYTLVVTPDANAEGTLTVDVSTTGVTDSAGNEATAPAQVSQPFDTLAPTITITDNMAGVANGAVSFTFTFSEAVSGFDASKVTVANGSKGTFSGSGSVYTLVVTPDAYEEGNLTVDVSSTGVTDAAGNEATAPAQVSQLFDTLARPSYAAASINPFGISNVSFNAIPALVDFDGDGDLDLFIGNNAGNTLVFRNTAAPGAPAPAYAAASTNPFGIIDVGRSARPALDDIDNDGDLDLLIGNSVGNTLMFRNTAAPGAITPAYAASSANPFGISDVGSNATPAFADFDGDGDLDLFIGNYDGNTLMFRNTAAPGAPAPAYAARTTNPFGISDVGSNATPAFADLDGDGDLDLFIGTYDGNTLVFRNTAAPGAIAPAYAAAATNPFEISDVGFFASPTFGDLDADGDLDLLIGNSAGDTLVFINTSPIPPLTLTITDNVAGVATGLVTFTFTFSQSVTGFNASKVTVVNGTKGAFNSIGNGRIYTLVVIPDSVAQGDITVDVNTSGVTNVLGTQAIAPAQVIQPFVDILAPTLTITNNNVAGVASAAVTFTFTFSESVTGFDASKVMVANGSKGAFSGSGSVYTLVITPAAGAQGTITVDVSTTGVTDVVGNQATAPAPVTLPFDTIAPTLTITDNTAGVANGATTFSFSFSESVTGFDASKVTVANGTKGTFTAISGADYTLSVTPDAYEEGAITVDVITTGVTDLAGNQLTAPAQVSQLFDTLPPSITSGANANAINENSGAAQVVYTATVTAAINDSVSFSLKSGVGDASAFSINSTTGAVTLTANPNFETKSNYSFTVVATDAVGNASEQIVALVINNLDEVAPTITSAARASVYTNVAAGSVVYTATASDTADISGGVTYSLGGNDAAAFEIDPNTGVVTIKASPSIETKPSYSFSVTATDAAGNVSAAKAVNLRVKSLAILISGASDNVGTIQGFIANGGETNDTTPTLSGTIPDALEAGQVVRITANGTILGNATVLETIWSFTPTLSSAGSYAFTAAIVNGSGEAISTSLPYTLVLDSTLPAQAIAITNVIDDAGLLQGSVAIAGVTNDAMPTITGTVSAAPASNEAVQVLANNVVLGQAAITAQGTSWTWTFTPSTPLTANAVTSITAQVIDTAGNLGPLSPARTFTLDTVAPTQAVVITTISDNVDLILGTIADGGITNDNTPTLQGTLSTALAAGHSVRVYANGAYLGNATVTTTNWTFMPTTSLSSSGSVVFTAAVVDAAGNQGSLSAPRSIVLDATAPTRTATISLISDNANLNTGPIAAGAATDDRTPTLSGTLSESLLSGETLKVFSTVGLTTTLLGDAQVTGTTWTFTPATALAANTYAFSLRIADAAGNLGVVSVSQSLVLDLTAPTQTVTITNVNDDVAPTTGSIGAGGSTNDVNPTITGILSALLTSGDSLKIYANGTWIGDVLPAPTTTSWSFTPTTPLAEGIVSITARVVDGAGNLGPISAARVFSIDTVAPTKTVAITTISDNVGLYLGTIANGGITNDGTPTLSGTVAAPLASGEVLQVLENGTTVLGNATVTTSAEGITTWAFTRLTALTTNGSYSYTARVVDSAGNSGPTSTARSIVLDITAPTKTVSITNVNDDVAPTTGTVAAGAATNDNTPTVSGTISAALDATSGEIVQVYATIGSATTATLLGQATVTGTTWTFTPQTPLGDNRYTLSARVEDAAGNQGTAFARVVIINTAAPSQTVVISTASDNAGTVQGVLTSGASTDDTTPTLSGTISAALASYERVEILRGGVLQGNATVTGTTWSYTAAALTAGAYSYTARVANTGGFQGAQTAPYLLTVDTTLPVATAAIGDIRDDANNVSIAAGATTTDATPSLSGTISGVLAATDTVKVLQVVGTTTTIVGDATINSARTGWSYTLPLQPNRSLTFAVAVFDNAGNKSATSATRSLTVNAVTLSTTAAISTAIDNTDLYQGVIASGGLTNDSTPSLTGTLSAELATGESVQILRGGVLQGTASVIGSTWSYTQATAIATSGSYSYTARVINSSDYRGAESAAYVLEVDLTQPTTTAAITAVTDDIGTTTGTIAAGGSTDDPTPTISGTLSSTLAVGDTVRVRNGAAVLGNAVVSGTNWSFTPALLPNATYNLIVEVVDAAGNQGIASPARALTVAAASLSKTITITDVTDDLEPGTGTVAAAGSTNDTTPTISGTVSAPLDAATGETVKVYANNVLQGDATVTNTSWTFSPTLTLEGSYSWSARVINAAGNMGTLATARTFTLDRIAPLQSVAITGATDNVSLIQGSVASGGATDDASPTLSGTLSAALATGESVQILLGGVLQGTASVTGSSWTYTQTPSISSGGVSSYTARVIDASGFSGPESSAFVLNLDITAPSTTATITAMLDNAGSRTGTSGVIAAAIQDDPTPSLSGTLSAALNDGESLKLFNGTTVLGDASVNNTDLTWTFTANLSTNGLYTFTALVTDAIGNQGPLSNSFSYTLDTVAPTQIVSIGSAADNVNLIQGAVAASGRTDDPTPTLSGTLSAALAAGETLQILCDGLVHGTATVAGSTWSYGSSALADGSRTFTAQVIDAAGLVGPLSAAYELVIDSQAPGTTAAITGVSDQLEPAAGPLAQGAITNDATPALNGTLSAVLADGEMVWILDNGLLLGTAAVSDLTWSFTSPLLADGSHSLTAAVVNNAVGNPGASSSPWLLTVDTLSPTQLATITAVSDNSGLITGSLADGARTDDTTPTLSGTLSAALSSGELLQVYATIGISGTPTLLGTATTSGTTWSFTPPTPVVATAEATFVMFNACIVDEGGNQGPFSAGRSMIFDTTTATTTAEITGVNDNSAPVTGDLADGAISNDPTPTLSGTLSAPLTSDSTVRVYANGTTLLGTATVSARTWSFTPSPALAAGTYSFTAAVVDAAGNEGTRSAPRSLTIDNVLPTQSVIILNVTDDVGVLQGTVAATTGVTNDATPTISGTVSAELATGEQLQVLAGSSVLGFATITGPSGTGSSQNWTFTPGTPLTSNALTVITAQVVDGAGNLGPASANRSFTLDTVAPAQSVTISTITDNVGAVQGSISEGASTNDPTPTISGSLSGPLLTNEKLQVYDNGSLLGSATVTTTAGVSTWSLTPTLTSNGNHGFTARVEDLAGNGRTDGLARSVILDAPIATAAIDTLTGTSDADLFLLPSLASSQLGSTTAPTFDTITNFQTADRVQVAGRPYNTSLTTSSGNAANLAGIATLLTSTVLLANTPKAVTVTGYTGTFVALNDATAGFQAANDSLVFLENYTVSPTNSIDML
jgi:hypothetical protein